MPTFPEILKPEMRFFDQRWIAGRMSRTLILPLGPDGKRTTQYDPKARFGVYGWDGKNWKLKAKCDSRLEARSAAAALRKILK
jgi:hypothetical protein